MIPVILLAQLCTFKTWQEYTVLSGLYAKVPTLQSERQAAGAKRQLNKPKLNTLFFSHYNSDI